MRRREFLGFSAAATLAAAQQELDVTTASATQDTTPRVSIVLSSFEDGTDHFGAPVAGLKDPQPVDAGLTSAQLDALVRRAIDLAATPRGDFASSVGAEDWVVIKTHIPYCYGLPADGGAYVRGAVTDPRIVRAIIEYLVEHKAGLRFTIVEGSGHWKPIKESGLAVDGWTTNWGGVFDGLSYQSMVDGLAAQYPELLFEILDLNFAPAFELPVPDGALASNNPSGGYTVPSIIRQCDRLVSVAPLATDPVTGVSLSLANYLGIAPGSTYGFPKDKLFALGSRDQIMIDLASYHPADLSVVGGGWGVEGDGTSVHHNVVIAGARPVCVDMVAASVMGFDPANLPFLALGQSKGLGTTEIDDIWVRGNEIDAALQKFEKPSAWRPPAGGGKASFADPSRRSVRS